MDRRRRIAVVALLVLAQLGGTRAVFCEEGSGRRVLELLTPCCGTVLKAGEDARADALADAGSCGPCRDLPAVAAMQKEDDEARAPFASLLDGAAAHAVVFSAPYEPRARLVYAHAAPPRRGPPDLVGTIVLTC